MHQNRKLLPMMKFKEEQPLTCDLHPYLMESLVKSHLKCYSKNQPNEPSTHLNEYIYLVSETDIRPDLIEGCHQVI